MSSAVPIIQYWDTEELPDYVGELIAGFRRLNRDMEHLIFSERTAGEFIEEHFGEREAAAFRACAVPTMQSDFFRYCAVYVLGGAYVDVAFSCLSPLRSLFDGVDGGRLFRKDPPGYLLSGFFLFRAPGHPLPRLVLDVATSNIEQRAAERVQMVTGPWILSSLSLLYELGRRESLREGVAEGGVARLAEPLCREAAAVVPTPGARKWIGRMVEPLIDAVGDYSRLTDAFEDICITPYEEALNWIGEPDSGLPYKRSDRYWLNWQREGRSIYR
jgi:hypothetical protein